MRIRSCLIRVRLTRSTFCFAAETRTLQRANVLLRKKRVSRVQMRRLSRKLRIQGPARNLLDRLSLGYRYLSGFCGVSRVRFRRIGALFAGKLTSQHLMDNV